jgi:hypothetical protein
MILWTIQTRDAAEALARRGELVADGGEPEPGFERAYKWMSARMTERLGAAPPGARPIWAWHTWQPGREKPLPDPAFHARIEASWERVFALETVIEGVRRTRRARRGRRTLGTHGASS